MAVAAAFVGLVAPAGVDGAGVDEFLVVEEGDDVAVADHVEDCALPAAADLDADLAADRDLTAGGDLDPADPGWLCQRLGGGDGLVRGLVGLAGCHGAVPE